MKKSIYIKLFFSVMLVAGIVSCTNLDEKVYSDIPLNEFFQSEKDVLMNAGRAYTKLQKYMEEFSVWSLTELASDEMVAPGRDDGFVWDNGRWDEIHKHHVSSTNKINMLAYQNTFEGISACNEIIYETESTDITFPAKDQIVCEIKVLRAYFYYIAMDNWGNIPFTIDFTDKNLPIQKDRQFVFNYIENEVLDNVDKLQDQPTSENYGRVTQGMAYTLLAKLYLNAEVWIGEDRLEDCVAACNKVIETGYYSIENDYFSNFLVNNEGSTENIFVIPMQSVFTKDHFYWYTLTLNDASRATFAFRGNMWDEFVLVPGFLDKYDTTDIRRNSFLFGQQKDMAGNDIIIDGEPFIYTPAIASYMARKKWEGARCCKYEYQLNLEYYVNDMENDFALFRYADVLYTKLEALWRLGRAGEMINDPALQQIRTRAGLQPLQESDLTADEFLDELGREFAWEGHRRQDQIRFGVWENSWWNKPPSDPTDKLFPIPQTALSSNFNLKQNDGY